MRSGILLCSLLLCLLAFGAHANRASRHRASAEDEDDDAPATRAPAAPVTQAPVSADILLDRKKKQALMQQQRASSKLTALREKEARLLDEIIRENQANIQRDGNPNSADSPSDISRIRTRAELNKDAPEQRLRRLTEAWHRAQQAVQAEVGRTQHDWGTRVEASGESTAARTRIRGELQQLLDEVGAELVAQYSPTTDDPEYRKQVLHEKKEADDLSETIQSEMGKEETLTREIDRDSPQKVDTM